jgi:two-component system, cell cycle sensor histidine kinase and response regulator CckA
MKKKSSDFIPQLDGNLCSALVNSIRCIIWECDPITFQFSYVSPQAERILGYPSRQWIEEPDFWRTHTHPNDVEWCTSYCREATEKREDHEFKYRMIAADGGIVWLHDIVTVARTEDGPASLRGIMIDITETKLAEISQHSNEKSFRLAMQDDITSLKRAEEELYLTKFCIDRAPLGVMRFALDGRVMDANEHACKSLGYSLDELRGMYVFDFDLAFPREKWHDNLQKQRESGSLTFETIHQRKDGARFPVEITANLLEYKGSEFLFSFERDITERKRAEQTLILREHYQRALLDNFPYAAWMKDEEGRFLAANRQLAAFLGLPSPGDLVGKTMYDVAPIELAERNTEEDHRVFAYGRTKHAEEQLPVNGEYRWFEVYQSPITIEGRVIGTVGCTWDITERKTMEGALKESEERYRRLIELSPDAVFIHAGGKFVFLNPSACKLLGVDRPDELYGREALDFIHPDQRDMVRHYINNALDKKGNPPVEELLVRLDGTTIPVEMVLVPHTYQGTDSILAIARDISERKRVQDELVKAQKLESLGVLAGGIAHDFNNILTGILGNISLVRAKLDPSDSISQRLESCEKAAIRATDLTQQLLTFARGGEPVKKLIDPGQLIRESASFVLRGSNVRTDITVADNLWWIEADSGQISQALNNVLINAIQAMPEGGIVGITALNEIVGEHNTGSLPSGIYLKIVIEDQGYGISPKNLPKIFDPYFTTKQKGSGLGLASVYSIIRRHGGTVQVSSTVGVGSMFTIFLPAVSGKRSGCDLMETKDTLAGNGRILIMDDEEIIREVAREILEIAGYQVESCADGREAVERIRDANRKNTPFNAVIMDLTVPGGMGGKEAAGLILEIAPDAVLIVSSGYSNDPVIANFRQYGFSGSVVKPFSFGSLAGEVQRLTRKVLPDFRTLKKQACCPEAP